MIDCVRSEEGLVFENQRDMIRARNICCGDDRDFVPGNISIKRDALDPPARNRAADSHTMEHFWK